MAAENHFMNWLLPLKRFELTYINYSPCIEYIQGDILATVAWQSTYIQKSNS